MSPEEQVAKLESLLDRIRHNASLPRAARSFLGAPPPLPEETAADVADRAEGAEFAEAAGLAEPAGYAEPGVVQAFETPIEDADEELIEEVELLDDDIVELGVDLEEEAPPAAAMAELELTPEPPAAALDATPESPSVSEAEVARPSAAAPQDVLGLDFDEPEPPISSQRPIASSMDEALATAAEALDRDDEHEVPLKTPPPESGPQQTSVSVPQSAPTPTPEQLGNTIELEADLGHRLELETPRAESEPAPVSEDLEVPLPGREAAGVYEPELAPPPEALSELTLHRQREAEREARLAQPVAPPVEPLHAPPPVLTLEPESVARPDLPADTVAETIAKAQAFRPASFVELLDASLSLGKS